MSKSIIAPIVAVIALTLQLAFGIEIPEDLKEQIILVVGNVVAVGFAIYGIFKDHKKTEGK